MKTLANEICNTLLDMDYADYEETQAEELQRLVEDLELLEKDGNGTLLAIIQMLVE